MFLALYAGIDSGCDAARAENPAMIMGIGGELGLQMWQLVLTLKQECGSRHIRKSSNGVKDRRRRQRKRCQAHAEINPLRLCWQMAPDQQVHDVLKLLDPNKALDGVPSVLDFSFASVPKKDPQVSLQ